MDLWRDLEPRSIGVIRNPVAVRESLERRSPRRAPEQQRARQQVRPQLSEPREWEALWCALQPGAARRGGARATFPIIDFDRAETLDEQVRAALEKLDGISRRVDVDLLRPRAGQPRSTRAGASALALAERRAVGSARGRVHGPSLRSSGPWTPFRSSAPAAHARRLEREAQQARPGPVRGRPRALGHDAAAADAGRPPRAGDPARDAVHPAADRRVEAAGRSAPTNVARRADRPPPLRRLRVHRGGDPRRPFAAVAAVQPAPRRCVLLPRLRRAPGQAALGRQEPRLRLDDEADRPASCPRPTSST